MGNGKITERPKHQTLQWRIICNRELKTKVYITFQESPLPTQPPTVNGIRGSCHSYSFISNNWLKKGMPQIKTIHSIISRTISSQNQKGTWYTIHHCIHRYVWSNYAECMRLFCTTIITMSRHIFIERNLFMNEWNSLAKHRINIKFLWIYLMHDCKSIVFCHTECIGINGNKYALPNIFG